MRRRYLAAAIPIGLVALLALPAMALAADPATQIQNLKGGLVETNNALNTTWLIVAAVLVMFMQAGFMLLEVGFSRMKNVGAGVAKILVNFSIASLCYWAVGFALAFGGLGEIAGTHGFFLNVSSDAASTGELIPFVGTYGINPAAFLFFQFVF